MNKTNANDCIVYILDNSGNVVFTKAYFKKEILSIKVGFLKTGNYHLRIDSKGAFDEGSFLKKQEKHILID